MKTEDLKVLPINNEKLVEFISQFVKTEPNQKIKTDKGAIVGENVITNNECCYEFVCKKLFNGQIQLVYEAPIFIITKTETGSIYPTSPEFYFDIPMLKIRELCDPEISLKEFMVGRFNYNPRITKNTAEFLKDIGSQLIDQE